MNRGEVVIVPFGPFRHTQYAAIVKLPSNAQSFLLQHPDGQSPAGPHNYTILRPLGETADPIGIRLRGNAKKAPV
jgi:hypothetical protein